MLAKLTSKGQTTIPKQVRARLGLRPGDHLLVWVEGDRMVARRADLARKDAPPRRHGPNRDQELIELLFETLDTLKRHHAEILASPGDEVLGAFAVQHVGKVGRVARGVSESLRSGGTPMLPWRQLTSIPSSGLSADHARKWILEDLDLPHAMLRTYFNVVPMRGYLDGLSDDLLEHDDISPR